MGRTRLVWTGERLQFLGHAVYGEPVSVGGDQEGPGAKPSDLLPISMAACTAYDVVVILRKQRQHLHSMEVDVTSEQDEDPPWTFRAIHSHFLIVGEVEERRAARAIELAEVKYCAVAATLRPVVAITHSFEVRPPA